MGPPPIMQRGQSLRQQVFPEKSGYLSGSHTRRPEIRLRLVSTNKGLKQMYRIRVRRGSAYLLSLMKGVWLGSLRTELAKVRNVKQARGDREIATWPVITQSSMGPCLVWHRPPLLTGLCLFQELWVATVAPLLPEFRESRFRCVLPVSSGSFDC